MNNYNIFLVRFGLDPSNFKQKEVAPIKTDTGYMYYLEQEKNQEECPHCGRSKLYVKGYYKEKVNVTINSNETDTLLIKRIRYQCRYCNKSFSPKLKGIKPYANISDIVKSNITYDFFKKNTFQEISERYLVDSSYVIKLFDETFPCVPRGIFSEVICIDEFHFSKQYDQNYCCVLCDFNNKKIIDVIRNRQKAYLDEYFNGISSSELSNVSYYISDMYDEYRVIRKKFFPNAIHIIDLFHIITQLVGAVDRLRVIAMKNSVELYSMEYNYMKKNWQTFLCREYQIPNKTYTFLKTGECNSYYDLVFKCIKKDKYLSIGYGVLQDLYRYAFNKNEDTINKFIEWIAQRLINSGSEILEKVGRTYLKWKVEIANAFSPEARRRKLTNATAEGMNNQIKTIIKSAYGYENFDRFRKRILLIYKYNYEKKS